MPYKDPEQQREYQRQWVAARRAEWFADKECWRCGSTDRLQLDHRDPNTKLTHRVWSWSQERREAELAKCQVLCKPCHDWKTAGCMEHAWGEGHGHSTLTVAQVTALREQAAQGTRRQDLATTYAISLRHVDRIVSGRLWRALL